VGEPGHDLGLALEPSASLGVMGEAGDEQLESPRCIERNVLDQPNGALAPAAELFDDPVLAKDELARLEMAVELNGIP